ncbi:hypothetical protein PDK93_27375, partial [Bacillus cereus]|nr:hypothetical protein [Bacillus cereus]
GGFLAFAKPNRPKTGLSCSTWISNYTRRTASSIDLNNKLIPYLVTLSSWGLAPKTPSQHSHPKTGGNSMIKHFYILESRYYKEIW